MKCLCVTVLGMVGLVGCANQTSSSAVDPFFGLTRIQPQATVMAEPRYIGDPAYADGQMWGPPAAGQPAASGISVAPMGVPAPGTGAGGAGTGGAVPPQNKYSPPGGFQYQGGSTSEVSSGLAVSRPGDRVTIPQAARQVPDWTRPPAMLSPVSGRPVIPSSIGSGGGGLVSPPASGGVVDIMDLPPVDNSSRLSTPAGESAVRVVSDQRVSRGDVVRIPSYVGDGAVVPAIALVENSSLPGQITPLFSVTPTVGSDRYDFDPDYRRLRGKLEYSDVARRWKLRYIPVDGTTDDFGGSVVIGNSSCLSGFERGDFVEAHGEVTSTAGDATGFAPTFSVTGIERIAR